jgi:hypothetical protein
MVVDNKTLLRILQKEGCYMKSSSLFPSEALSY